MIEFLWPFAFALLPLPFLVRWLMKPAPVTAAGALRVPFFARLSAEGAGRGDEAMRHPVRLILSTLIWVLLVTALARPTLVGEEQPLPAEGRNIMMAVDLSGSMGEEDFSLGGLRATRLTVVKETAEDFISRREGDRIGLVLFSDRAYLQAPLTFDRKVVTELLDEAQVGLTGKETAIGDAIGVAVKRLKDRPKDSRVLVLLTDGANNAGAIDPMRAAELAKDLDIRIYTIGVGADRQMMTTPFGRTMALPSHGLDEDTLKAIASETGGEYFRAKDVSGLASIYRAIDRLEPVAGKPQSIRPSVALYYWPLSVALLFTFLMAAMMSASAGLKRLSAPRPTSAPRTAGV